MLALVLLVVTALAAGAGAITLLGDPGGLWQALAVAAAVQLVIAYALSRGMRLAQIGAALVFLGHMAVVLIVAVLGMAVGAFGAGFSIYRGSGKFDPIVFIAILAATLAVLLVYALAIRSALRFPGRRRIGR